MAQAKAGFERIVELKRAGDAEDGFGLRFQKVRTLFKASRCTGCEIFQVLHGGPASKMHLLPGDYILEVNDTSATELSPAEVAGLMIGNTVKLTVLSSAIMQLQLSKSKMKKFRKDRSYPREMWIDPLGTKIQWLSASKPSIDAFVNVRDIKEVR